ncbi:hypothetical protein GR212_26855 [Rhizobium lusitanum]|uniref:Uncharacterized protein n=1 Tax=Rhizobium lusitanum TaxID=293958 RepID=A0A6L9UAX8_9HYPH|nr:hypothetical protein [Rhizobium lusitanum]NEI73185.1 hypothetical protein [Rhizobium lusitanum]
MLDLPGEGLVVGAELFEIEAYRLTVLDRLEHLGSDGSISFDAGGGTMTAIVCMKLEMWLDPFQLGFLSDYHDRKFIPSWKR